MSAPVRIEGWVWTDPRFMRLANALDVTHDDAIAKMVRAWAEQTRMFAEWQKAHIDGDRSSARRMLVEDVAVLWQCSTENAKSALEHTKLAKVTHELEIHFAGEDRLWWLADKTRAGSKGGKAKAKSLASRKSNHRQTTGKPQRKQNGSSATHGYGYGYGSSSNKKGSDEPSKRVAVLEAARSVVAAFNATFERKVRPETFLDNVSKCLKAGHTEAQMRGVVWWASQEWPPDHDYRPKLTPATLLKLNPSRAGRSFVTYLGLATERWETLYPTKPVPWGDK